jgi:uncharacterized protein YbjT (DUF2867 family)
MILVSGATGTNGKEIVLQLAALGANVRALVRDMNRALPFRGKCVHMAVADFNQPESLPEAFKSVERALLLASSSPKQVEQERNFIDAAKLAGVRHVVKFSAHTAQNLESRARLIRWHAEAEDYLEQSGLEWTHLRPTFFMQNLLGQAGSIAREGVFYTALGNTPTAMVDVRDIAAVAVRTLLDHGHERKSYTITGPESLTQDAAAERLSAALGKPVRHVSLTPEQWKQSLVGSGMPEWFADALLELNEYVAKPFGSEITDTITQVAKKQPITFEQFAHDHAASFASTNS